MFELFLILFLSWMFSTTVLVGLLAIVALGNLDKTGCNQPSRTVSYN